MPKRKASGSKTSKRRAGAGRKRSRSKKMKGRGFWDDVKGGLSKANDFLRDSKLVSTVGSALGSAGVPYASQIGSVAKSLGYGKRRRGGSKRADPTLRMAPVGFGGSGKKVLKF